MLKLIDRKELRQLREDIRVLEPTLCADREGEISEKSAQAQLEADRRAIESCETTTVLDKEDDSKNYEAYLVPVKSIKEYQQLKGG